MGLFNTGFNQFEWARWHYSEGEFKQISVAIVTENEKRYGTVARNIITDTNNTVISTTYPYDYKVRQEIYYRGNYWEIVSVGTKLMEIAPQALGHVRSGNRLTILELIKVDRPR